MSYLDASATEALLEEGVAKKAGTEEKSIAMKIFSYFMFFVGWSPLVIFFVVSDRQIAITGAAGKCFANRMDKTALWSDEYMSHIPL